MPKSTISIVKVKTGYRVKYYAANGELLAMSEVLETKANANKNIRAIMKLIKEYLTPPF